MTPEQISSIISAMPEGKRKRACLSLFESAQLTGTVEILAPLWGYIESQQYAKAAIFLIGEKANVPTANMLADMIWEGGA